MWQPWMRREYGIHPYEMRRYTVGELNALVREADERSRAMREAGE